MEKFVVSRELAEKLKVAGYSQNTEFSLGKYRAVLNEGWKVWPTKTLKAEKHYDRVAAPLSDELLEQLPIWLPYETENHVRKRSVKFWKHDNGYAAGYSGIKDFNADKPADALAQLWLWWKEQQ